MKNTIGLLFAAILGSVITLGMYTGLGFQKKSEPVQAPKLVENKTVTYTGQAPISKPDPVRLNPPADRTPIDFTYAAAKTTPAVVHIKARSQYSQSNDPSQNFFDEDFFYRRFFGNPGQSQNIPRESSGSGVIIAGDGLIVTNNHVVEGASELEVTLNDNRSYQAELIGTDPSTDLAIIRIKESGLPTLALANSDKAQVGQWVLAVGNPFNLASTVTAGIVSAKGRNLSILDSRSSIESFIQTDAAVNPGNSGGALVDTDGDLLGINTAIATPTGTYAGYSFAVPVNIVKKVVDDLLEYGQVQRGFIGVHIEDLNSESAKTLGLNISQGVVVKAVVPNGAAAAAGIRDGDVIVNVDGKTINTTPELQETIGRKRPGDQVNVRINRSGRMKDISLKLKNGMGNSEMITRSASAGKVMEKLGIDLIELDANDRNKYQIDGGLKVVDIREGKIKQNTDIKEGFIITRIDGKPVGSLEEMTSYLNNKSGGIMIEGKYPNYPGTIYYAFGLD